MTGTPSCAYEAVRMVYPDGRSQRQQKLKRFSKTIDLLTWGIPQQQCIIRWSVKGNCLVVKGVNTIDTDKTQSFGVSRGE